MKDIEVGNSEILENGGLKLSRESKAGIIITLCAGMSFGVLNEVYLNNMQNEVVTSFTRAAFIEDTNEVPVRDQVFIDDAGVVFSYEQETPINASLEEINSLKIIINDNDCREDFINSVCEELDKDGIKFQFTQGGKDMDVDGAVVITLDQQYVAGPATVIFAPLENGREGQSDALALAAKKAFHEKGFLVDGVACGQMGFRENENGTISERIPTDTETTIGTDKNTSFVTISFGTQNANPKLTAESIEAMLTRYYAYVTGEYGQEDLIYCVEEGQSYDDIAEILGTTGTILDQYNTTSDESVLLVGETLINPVVARHHEFNEHITTNLNADKNTWFK